VKVWEKREYRDLDDSVTIGSRNIKVALKRLRKFAREGLPEHLDMDDTIRSTARNAGYLDLKMVPERHNAVKVLLFFDVGGSMDPHVHVCEELFRRVGKSSSTSSTSISITLSMRACGRTISAGCRKSPHLGCD